MSTKKVLTLSSLKCVIFWGEIWDEKTESILNMTSAKIGSLNANAFAFKCHIGWSHEINMAGLYN